VSPDLGTASVCARCAARGPTCCEPEDGVALAPLTPGDVERIAAATHKKPSEFSTLRELDEDERRALEADDPVLRGLIPPGAPLRSLAKRGRACVFHEAGRGCSLAYEVRPLLCRRFPIVRMGRRFRVSPGGDCLAVEEARDLPDLLRLLGTREDEYARIDREIRADLKRR
jgi:Fe-S-cluster containining protein